MEMKSHIASTRWFSVHRVVSERCSKR